MGTNFIRLACAGLLISGTMATAQVAVEEAGEPAIDALIADLSSADAEVRASAQKRLIGMGDKAREALEAHIKSQNAALEALNNIEIQRVAAPTLVTLDLDDVSGIDAFNELQRVTDIQFRMDNVEHWQNQGIGNVTLSVKDQPFWEVMREISRQSGLTIYPHGGGREPGLRIMPARQVGGNSLVEGPAVIDGAAMLVATSIQRNNSVNLARPDNVNSSLSMQFQVMVEPKVVVTQTDSQVHLEEAVDENGNSLIRDRHSSGGHSMGRQGVWNVSAQLHYPTENPGSRITRLAGHLKYTVQTRSETIEFDDLSQTNVSKEIGGQRIELISVTSDGDNPQVRVEVIHRRNTASDQAFNLSGGMLPFKLLDENGIEFQQSGSGSSGSRDQRKMNLTFVRSGNRAPGKPAKLVLELPVSTQEVVMPFEFKDLPLP